MFQIGFQYDPVLSSTAWVTPRSASQSANRPRFSVIVPKVRSSLCGWPAVPGVSTHATTVFLCTSNPQHRSCTTCIAASSPV
jgi:hypothetical protein